MQLHSAQGFQVGSGLLVLCWFLPDPSCYLHAPILNYYLQVGKQKENIQTNLE